MSHTTENDSYNASTKICKLKRVISIDSKIPQVFDRAQWIIYHFLLNKIKVTLVDSVTISWSSSNNGRMFLDKSYHQEHSSLWKILINLMYLVLIMIARILWMVALRNHRLRGPFICSQRHNNNNNSNNSNQVYLLSQVIIRQLLKIVISRLCRMCVDRYNLHYLRRICSFLSENKSLSR